jgi:hypothetical protein
VGPSGAASNCVVIALARSVLQRYPIRSLGVTTFMLRRQLVGYWSWLLATALLAAIAGLGLAETIAIAGSEENRAPAANIIIAALALCAGLAAIRYPVQRLRGRSRPSTYMGCLLALLAVVLIFLLWVALYATVGQT